MRGYAIKVVSKDGALVIAQAHLLSLGLSITKTHIFNTSKGDIAMLNSLSPKSLESLKNNSIMRSRSFRY